MYHMIISFAYNNICISNLHVQHSIISLVKVKEAKLHDACYTIVAHYMTHRLSKWPPRGFCRLPQNQGCFQPKDSVCRTVHKAFV